MTFFQERNRTVTWDLTVTRDTTGSMGIDWLYEIQLVIRDSTGYKRFGWSHRLVTRDSTDYKRLD